MKEEVSALFRRALYFLLILLIALGSVYLYILWWDHRESLNPEVTTVVPASHADRIPARGILLWREELVISAWDGGISYSAEKPARVAKGETVAVVSAPGGKKALGAAKVGYFLPALDGEEGKWTYSAFWNGMEPLPKAPPLRYFPLSGGATEKGRAVGKLIPQPQDLRCILYADLSPSLQEDIKGGFVRIKVKDTDWPSRAEVRVARFHESKVKLYLTLPFFPAAMTTSREISLIIESGERSGVSVPETAVLSRDGRIGVLLVEGNMVKFKSIKGLPSDGGAFFIEEGLKPGNVVVLHAQDGKEGKIRLW